MYLLRIIQPLGHLLDVGRHIVRVVHTTHAGNNPCRISRDGAPAPAREYFRETLGALGAYPTLPPPILHLRNVGGTLAAFEHASHSV